MKRKPQITQDQANSIQRAFAETILLPNAGNKLTQELMNGILGSHANILAPFIQQEQVPPKQE